MPEEDLLKKRIQNKGMSIHEDGINRGEMVHVLNVLEILDEANRSFPDESDEKYKDRDIPVLPDQKSGNYYKFKYDAFIDDVKEWRKKYLGEAENK